MFEVFTSKPNKWMPAKDRFWYYVEKTDSCWMWTGPIGGGDCEERRYGQLQINGKKVYAHRYSWELHNGSITNDDQVCHTCDVNLCIRPSHLFLGSQSINMQDMVKKGRHWSMKIFGRDREDIAASELPTRILAGAYRVHRTTIQKIRRKARAALKVIDNA